MSVTELRLAVQGQRLSAHSMRGQTPHARRLAEQGGRHAGRDRALVRHQYRHLVARSRRRSTSTSPTPAGGRARRGRRQGAVRRPRQDPGALRRRPQAGASVSHRGAVPEDVGRVRGARRHRAQDRGPVRRSAIHHRRHPPRHQEPYTWHGGTPQDTPRDELAEVTEERHAGLPRALRRAPRAGARLGRVYTNGHGARARRRRAGPVRRSTTRLAAMRFGGAGASTRPNCPSRRRCCATA